MFLHRRDKMNASQEIVHSQVFKPFIHQFVEVEEGQNILLKMGNSYSLMKYEKSYTETESADSHRYNRHTRIHTGIGDFLFANTKEKKQKLNERRRREWKRHKGNVYGTHRLDFTFDEEFELFLPSSKDSDMFLTLARETSDGEVVLNGDVIEVTTDNDLIESRLRGITYPQYFNAVVVPFLENRHTEFQIPKYSKRWFRKTNRFTLCDRFEKETQKLEHGAFVYVGCKEEVYLLGLARNDDGSVYMQGTYTTSTKPLFYFSNNYLDFVSKYDAEKPKFDGDGMCNVAEYRTYDISEFSGQKFIFPQMGRTQDCKNTIFTGEPELITGDSEKALEHFTSTDFAEFSGIVERYAKSIKTVHSSAGEPNGRFYY